MRILIIGATGVLGSAVAAALEPNHDVLKVSRSSSLSADLDDPASIDHLFTSIGKIDAVVCTAQSGALTPLDSDRWDDDFATGMKKLTGQVALFRRAIAALNNSGSITLTSGRFSEPLPGSSVGRLVNSGLEAFVQSAALELPRGLRANIVSPGWIKETLQKLGMNDASGTPAHEVARAYVEAVEGKTQAQVLTP